MADRDEILNQFASITGVDQDRARFHLESSAWNLEVAIANFYEEHEEDEGSAANPLDVEELEEEVEPEPQLLQRKKKTSKPKGGRFGTIDSLRGEEDSSSDEEGQAFYAGGSERSGQQVLGPKKKNNDAFVSDLFQSARDHGAEEMESSAATASASRSSAFHGTGYRLGETEGPLESVAGPSIAAPRRQVDMTLKMWKKGFSIDSGDLRPYDDSVNKDFLESIRRGEVPHELIRMAKGGEVNLSMEDHRTEDFVKPKVTVKAFTGEGHMLGSPAPAVVTTPSSGASAAATPAAQVDVDSSKPVTTLQIRLADGQRMVAKFNLTHTVGDIRTHIVSSHGQYASTSFVLMTTFPNKELTDERQTLEEAKLANAVIVQRLK
ncbi:NSFL1 cofactor p47-like [Babylonia areolata]|uniref:NSFL1 cofactor p47-like n=1 Tax=Babylonia areolata TaxID=304850 RepID=UPI003FD0C989